MVSIKLLLMVSIAVLLCSFLFPFCVLAIHPLLDGTSGGATVFSFSKLLVSGRATLSKGLIVVWGVWLGDYGLGNSGCDKSRAQQGAPLEG